MEDNKKRQQHLLEELGQARQRVAELETRNAMLMDKNRLKDVTNHANFALFVLDRSGKPFYVNRTAEKWFANFSAMEPMNFWQYFNLSDPYHDGRSALTSGKTYTRDVSFMLDDKKQKCFHLVASLVNNEDSGVEQVNVLLFDITSRKKTEEALDLKRQELVKQNKDNRDFLQILEKTASSLNFHESLNKILPYINNLMQSRLSIVYCRTPREAAMEPSHHYRLSLEELAYFMSTRFDADEYMPGDLKGEALFVDDSSSNLQLPESTRELMQRIGSRCAALIPVTYEGELKSLITCLCEDKVFSDKDRQIANNLQKHLEASYIAYKHSLSLLSKTVGFTQQLQIAEAMSKIDRSILNSSSQEEIIYGTINLFESVIPGEITQVLKYDSGDQLFKIIASYEDGHININSDTKFRICQIKSSVSTKFGMPDYFSDLTKEYGLKEYEMEFVNKGYRSLLVIPLLSKGELLGLISIASVKPAGYSAEQLSIAQRLGNQMSVALSNASLINQLQDLLIGTINSLATTLDAKSPWTKGHSHRVSEVAVKIGNAAGLDEKELYNLRLAALFHDIGKIGIFDAILDKPTALTEEERTAVEYHAVKTFDILHPIPNLTNIAVIAKSHHERWDGNGYPDGLTGEDIPVLSRIIALADSYDAMITDRPYRKGLSADDALDQIRSSAGTQFDPRLTDLFSNILEGISTG